MNKYFIKCVKSAPETEESLDEVGARWREDSNVKHPIRTLIAYADTVAAR